MLAEKNKLRDCSRVKRFPITGPMLLDIFAKGQTIRCEIVEGLPTDSMIVRHHYDDTTGFYFITIQSQEFDPVPMGAVIPILVVTIKQLNANVDDYTRGMVDEANLWNRIIQNLPAPIDNAAFTEWREQRLEELKGTPVEATTMKALPDEAVPA